MDQADGQSLKLSNKIMVSSWMGDPMVCIFQLDYFFQVEFSCKSILCFFWKKIHLEKKSRWKNLHISPQFVTIETDLAWSSSLEDVRIMVRHEACPPGGNLVLMCAVVSNAASAVP